MKKLIVATMLLGSLSASAITIDISNVNCGSVAGTSDDTSTLCGQLTSELESYVNQDLPDVSIGDYGTGIANANNFAYKGTNSDYSDKFDLFMIKGSTGIAVQGDIRDPESAEGIGLGAAVTAGLNLDFLPVDKIGPVELKKLDLFVSFMSSNIDRDFDKTNVEGDLSHFAVTGRYQIIEGKEFIPGSLLKWGGVFLHTGFQSSTSKITATSEIEDDNIGTDGDAATADITDSTATFEIEADTWSIPIELSTYIRAAYVFTLFGGVGADIVQGSTDVSLDAGGTITGTGASSGYTASVDASESDSGDADVTNMRVFGGVQFNIPLFRLYAQMNSGIGNDLIGLNLGAKILW